ncbi:alpha/beta hydrolase [Paracoccus nototheniae]|uniref:RBBP9/YdeN family alpha/beta hydrolase n=1 Tax=Paracoccus nototheniae TaxID=2489002 RepID=A0ABW4DX01_9RHOB|nr:alpha/beta hydrolase [Paracoccus nototheniae]
MTKTLIVPGLDGSPAPHWQDWWARTDPDAMMLDMGDTARPVREVWQATLAVHVMTYPDSILVGHSLGAVTIAQLLARWPGLRIRAALLVAPVDPRAIDRIAGFGAPPREAFDVPALVVASRNDPLVSFDASRRMAADWDADLYDLGHAGHINTASGFGPWTKGKELRDLLLARTRRPSALRRMFGAFRQPA